MNAQQFKQILNEYKVPLFLFLLVLIGFTTFFALTIGISLPTIPSDPAPTPTNNTTTTPTPTNNTTGNQSEIDFKMPLMTYHNQTKDGFITKQTHTRIFENRTGTIKIQTYYKPETSFYYVYNATSNGQIRLYYESYYTTYNGWQRNHGQVRPDEIETSLADLQPHRKIGLVHYLIVKDIPTTWKHPSPDKYTYTTSLQNDPYAPQNGTMTVTTTIDNNKIQTINITLTPAETTNRSVYGQKTIINATIEPYHEPEFYWKPNQTTTNSTQNALTNPTHTKP